MSRSAEDYLVQLQALLPQGAAWTRKPSAVLTKLLAAIAAAFAATEARALRLVEEADPSTAIETLDEWEGLLGLPDACTAANGPFTLAERRAAVAARLSTRPNPTPAFFRDLAESLGYAGAEVETYAASRAGVLKCGEALGGPAEGAFIWRLRVPGARVGYFRAGASQAGEPLAAIAEAQDLACLIQRLAPAHTQAILSYEG